MKSAGGIGTKAVDKNNLFEKNILALSARDPQLCAKLSVADTSLNRYEFRYYQAGKVIPAIADDNGAASPTDWRACPVDRSANPADRSASPTGWRTRPLHSAVNPEREAERLVTSLRQPDDDGCFLVFLGLGGGYAPAAALHLPDVSHALVIDYDINGVAELFCTIDYSALIKNPRFTLLVDPPPDLIESALLELYRPAVCGGLKVLPLRPRTECDTFNFTVASDTIQKTLEKISSDYSAQAYFGTRWFSNIIRNLNAAENQNGSVPPVREAAIVAAGPSLDTQIPLLLKRREQREELYVISADTALPALLHNGLRPDAVVSIDCQHYSYYHFAGISREDIPLFLDMVSPPMLADFSRSPFFFSGGHPLAVYISQNWRPLPLLDTSGGNVTHACLSLAEKLGARRITVYGADFSYPAGKIYARGTYIHPFFERKQQRLNPLEAQISSFLFRSILPQKDRYIPVYETKSLRFYRTSFERKIAGMEAEVIAAPGLGIPLEIKAVDRPPSALSANGIQAAGKAAMSANEFLRRYRQDINALPVQAAKDGGSFLQNLNMAERQIFITLLPLAAALLRRFPELTSGDVLAAVKQYCVNEIDKVMDNRCQS